MLFRSVEPANKDKANTAAPESLVANLVIVLFLSQIYVVKNYRHVIAPAGILNHKIGDNNGTSN